jgi:hypothetical protein
MQLIFYVFFQCFIALVRLIIVEILYIKASVNYILDTPECIP